MAAKPTIIGTGLSGMIGSRLTELLKHDYSFQNLDLTTNIDITDKNQTDLALSKHSPTTVINFAAFTDVSKAFEQKGDKNGLVYQVNTQGAKNIAQSSKKHGHYLIHISTDFVFDGQKDTPYTENDTPHPIEWYGQTKYWAEQAVQAENSNAVILRTAFPFRAKFDQKLDLVRTMITKLKDNSLYPMFADQIITPTFADDLCQAIKVVIQKQPTGIYHAVGSTSLSPFQLAQKVAQIFGFDTEIKKGSFVDYLKKDPRPRQQYLKISNQKIKHELGIEFKTIDQSLKALKAQISPST